MAGEEAQLGAHVGPGEGSRNLKNRLPQGSVGGLGGVRRRLACQYGASPVRNSKNAIFPKENKRPQGPGLADLFF